MLWEAYQQINISSAKQSAEHAKSKAERVTDNLSQLDRQLRRLTLACQGMWELIRDNTEFTEDDLEKKILEIDLRDGKADGKIGTQILQCPQCRSNTNSRRTSCLMCGAPLPKQHAFET